MRRWWQELAPRERRTLLLGAATLAAMAFYFLVWLPPQRAIPQLREQLRSQGEDLEWMREQLPRVRALRSARQAGGDGGPPERALYALADESARAAELGDAIEQVEPAGERQVRVTLSNASFQAVLRWLAGLRREHGIRADSASLQATDTPGRVDVRLVLRGPDA